MPAKKPVKKTRAKTAARKPPARRPAVSKNVAKPAAKSARVAPPPKPPMPRPAPAETPAGAAPLPFSEPVHVAAPSRDGTVVVVLDSSSLFMPFQSRIDPVAETKRLLHKPLEFVVPGPVAEEIRRVLDSGYGRSKRDAKAALQYADRFAHKAGRGQGDDAVLNMAIDERHAGKTAVIVTTDVGLRRRARAFHVPVLFMRSKGHLMLDGYIE